MNLYLSEFTVSKDIDRHPSYAEATSAVLLFCSKNSIHCWRSNEFTDYAVIESRIKESDVFVALIDQYWNSSTWKGHEFVYSDGDSSMVDGVKGKQISKRIALLVEGVKFPTYLDSYREATVIVRNISELNNALAQVPNGRHD